jgi:Amt family ammonium transporter
LTGVFTAEMFGGTGLDAGIGGQLWIQIKSVLFTIFYTGTLSFIILKVLDVTMGLRVSEDEEQVGLDLSAHDERGYVL